MEKPAIQRGIDINLDQLKKVCQDYIDFMDNDDEYHEDNDFHMYIFEEAMKALYGENVFDWINKRQD